MAATSLTNYCGQSTTGKKRREAFVEEQRQIKERGFLAVMWPHLIAFLVLMGFWVVFLRWYF